MKKWFKKLAGEFAGTVAPNDSKPVVTPPPAPTPPVVVKPAPPVAALAQPALQRSVAEFEKAREDFFKALKANDSTTIESIAADYPGEALQWRTDQGTPLGIAQRNSSLDAFKSLLKLGADKEETYAGGDFPLHYAQMNGQKDFFDFLLAEGADIERPYSESTYQHMVSTTTTHTALGTAILQGDKEAAITLMERGAKVNAPYSKLRDHMSMLVGGAPSQPVPKTAVEYATEQKQFLIADIAKRAHILRSDYVARETATTQMPSPEPIETDSTIGVMQPLRLKKQQDVTP